MKISNLGKDDPKALMWSDGPPILERDVTSAQKPDYGITTGEVTVM